MMAGTKMAVFTPKKMAVNMTRPMRLVTPEPLYGRSFHTVMMMHASTTRDSTRGTGD